MREINARPRDEKDREIFGERRGRVNTYAYHITRPPSARRRRQATERQQRGEEEDEGRNDRSTQFIWAQEALDFGLNFITTYVSRPK